MGDQEVNLESLFVQFFYSLLVAFPLKIGARVEFSKPMKHEARMRGLCCFYGLAGAAKNARSRMATCVQHELWFVVGER